MVKQYALIVYDNDSPIPDEDRYPTLAEAVLESKKCKGKRWQINEITAESERMIQNSEGYAD